MVDCLALEISGVGREGRSIGAIGRPKGVSRRVVPVSEIRAVDGFQGEMIQHERQVENRAAQMNDFEIQQECGRLLTSSGHDHVLWAVVTVHHAEAVVQHGLGGGLDDVRQVRMRVCGGPVVGINAQNWTKQR